MKNRFFVGALSILLLIQVGTFGMHQNASAQSETNIPSWIKSLGGFWADGNITDEEFVTAIEYLIQSKIITSERLAILDDADVSSQEDDQKEVKIPNWIRNNAKWFAEDVIQDSDFVLGLEFMVEEEIIQSPKIQIIEKEDQTNIDSDGDGLPDGKDACPNQAEVINGFEDSDGCPDEVPGQDKSLTISDVEIEWENSGWGDPRVYLFWTYYVDIDELESAPSGHFSVEVSGLDKPQKAEYDSENKYKGQFNGIFPGEGGTITLEVLSFIGDEGWIYEGDGNKQEIIIPPFTSEE